MRRFISADWIRVTHYWLTWVLLVLLVGIPILQVKARLDRFDELETEVATGLAATDGEALSPSVIELNRFLMGRLRDELSYPAFIGSAARLATDYGWFLVVVLTAVMGGEDFNRRTLRGILGRGLGRVEYLLARLLVLWLAMGVAVALVAGLAAIAGPAVHGRVNPDPLSLEGLEDALLLVLRSWITYLPFIALILFLAVLGRNAGPAMGVGLSSRFIGFLNGLIIPGLAVIVAAADASGTEGVPAYFRWQTWLFGATVGYNATVFLYWGDLPMELTHSLGIDGESWLSGGAALSNDPWRAVAVLAGYTVLCLGLAVWIMCRRDVTYES